MRRPTGLFALLLPRRVCCSSCAHGFAFQLDATGVTHQAIEDVVGNGAMADLLLPGISDLRMNMNKRPSGTDRGRQRLRGSCAARRLSTARWMGRSEERRVGKECRSRWSPY